MAARGLAKAIGDKGKVYVSNVKPGVSTTDQREEGFKLEMKDHPNIEVLETQFNDDDANKAAAQVQAVLGRVPDLAGVFGANLFSATGTANGVKQAGKSGMVKIAGFDAPESVVGLLKDGTFDAHDRPASGRDRLLRLHGRLRQSHRQSGSDCDRHRLHRHDQRQHRRPERLAVPLQELVTSAISKQPDAAGPSEVGGPRFLRSSRTHMTDSSDFGFAETRPSAAHADRGAEGLGCSSSFWSSSSRSGRASPMATTFLFNVTISSRSASSPPRRSCSRSARPSSSSRQASICRSAS